MAAPNAAPAVRPRFDLSTPAGGPFPSDRFTVADPDQHTGRRVALPMPDDRVARRSDRDDLCVLNELDGFHQHPRVSIPFDGDIDPSTVHRGTVFIVSAPPFEEDAPSAKQTVEVVAVSRIVWDPATRTLHAQADEALEEHSRYALVVTRGVLDAAGRPVEASAGFRDYRRLLADTGDPQLRWYRDELVQAERAARAAGVDRPDLVALSVFRTQSSTFLARRLHDQIFAGPVPAPADFAIGPGGSRAVYPLERIASVSFNRQLTSGAALSPEPGFLDNLRSVPGTVARVAFGRYASPDYRVHPGEYVPAVPSRGGAPVRQGSETVYFNLYLPSGPMPAAGWPVVIVGHGSVNHKNFMRGSDTSYPAAHGVAWLMINAAGYGFGPRSTLRLDFADGASVELPAGGRSVDQDGDGQIAVNEGFRAAGARALRDQSDGYLQTAADLMQLVRVVQAGVDVDGDGRNALDASRITYWGWSIGSNYGMLFFAATPEVRAAVFSTIGAPTLEHRRLSPIARPTVGAMLAARTPPLLNSEHGLTSIDGVEVPPPRFDEHLPLRGAPPMVDPVPGAAAIQEVLERSAWAGRNANPAAYAPLVRRRPPAGEAPRPVLIQFGRGDWQHQNPGTSELLRVAALEDCAWLYRHDRFYPTMPPDAQRLPFAKNAHWFHYALDLAPCQPIVAGAHEQAARFLASDGRITPAPTPAPYWEVPAVLPDDLGYIR